MMKRCLGFLFSVMAMVSVVGLTFSCGYTQGQSGGAGGMPPGGGMGGMAMPGMDMGPTGFFQYSAGDPFPEKIESQMTVAIYVEDGRYQAGKSDSETVSGGTVTDGAATGISITSKTDNFSGILVTGGGAEYILSDTVMALHGSGTGGQMGGNYGVAAGAVAGHGKLTLKNVKITTNGSASSAAVCSAGGTLKVYDSVLISKAGGSAGRGSRTTNTSTNGKSYFYNSTIVAESWGALSTDSAEPSVYLEANECDIRTVQGGYGVYADNSCKVVINDSRFDTANHAGIISGTGQIYFNNVTAATGASLVEVHAPGQNFRSVGNLEINGGTATTEDAVLFVKSANVEITVDGAELISKSGLLLQSVVNTSGNTPQVTGSVAGIQATFKNMALKGDIRHEDNTRSMSVALAGTTLEGTIRDASLSLDSGSRWVATGDSRVTLLGSTDVAAIDGAPGVTISADAGKGCKLQGVYKLPGGATLEVAAR